ncbi:MAG: hypothetical protein IKK73_04620 [Akkermansia sp.]|nr:hypothetical protein [Akkermansia sp.]MBR6576396.1 hypothetical protein [Akkermansia sp.]
MNMKSITFRCSEQQNSRLNTARHQHACSRTSLITEALESFLSYAEQAHIRKKDLFALVEDIETSGDGTPFEEQA